MMEKLLIFPYNGNGLEALDCAKDQYDVIGFIDDTQEKQGQSVLGLEVFSRDVLEQYHEVKVLAVPGSPSSYLKRKMIIAGLQLVESRFATIIHPAARVSSLSHIGYNVLIMAGVVITSNAVLGNHLCILPNTVIHHDVHIGDYTLMGSNIVIAGATRIGRNCYVGSGSNIMNGIEIGDYALIGMGTNVIRNLPANKKVVGNPARILGDVQ
jgi:sugar O-acyltransferase (sialic acid O-acetyltransferase NeuD family)